MNLKHYFIALSFLAFFSIGSIASANIVIPDEVSTYDKASPAFFVDGINAEQAELKNLKGTVYQKDTKVNSDIQFKITKDRKNKDRILATANPLVPGSYIIKVKYKGGQEVQSDLKVYSSKPANKIYIPHLYYGDYLKVNFLDFFDIPDHMNNYSILVRFDGEYGEILSDINIHGLIIRPKDNISLKDECENVSITFNWANPASGQKIELYSQSFPIIVPEPEIGLGIISDFKKSDNGNYIMTIGADIWAPGHSSGMMSEKQEFKILKRCILEGMNKDETIKHFMERGLDAESIKYVEENYETEKSRLEEIKNSREFSAELLESKLKEMLSNYKLEFVDAKVSTLTRYEKNYIEIQLVIKGTDKEISHANMTIPLKITQRNSNNGKKSRGKITVLPVMILLSK